jgi:hypothetical protein
MFLQAAAGYRVAQTCHGTDRLAALGTKIERGLEFGPASVAEHSSPPMAGAVILLYAKHRRKVAGIKADLANSLLSLEVHDLSDVEQTAEFEENQHRSEGNPRRRTPCFCHVHY